jgi:hypothetical protein
MNGFYVKLIREGSSSAPLTRMQAGTEQKINTSEDAGIERII